MTRKSRLPSRFPVGTKFVIEGRRLGEGQVHVSRRYIEFPDGTCLRLPARPVKHKSASAARRLRGTRISAPDRGPRLGERP